MQIKMQSLHLLFLRITANYNHTFDIIPPNFEKLKFFIYKYKNFYKVSVCYMNMKGVFVKK